MKNNLFLLLSLLIIFSCSNTDDEEIIQPSPPDNPPVYLLHKIFKDGKLLRERTYDADSILTTQTTYGSSGSIFLKQSYTYAGDTIKTISFNGNNDTTQLRSSYPTSNATLRVDRFNPDGTLDNYAIYTFLSEACGFTSYRFYHPDGTAYIEANIEYTDSNCSATTSFYDNLGNLSSSESITRDDKSSPAYKLVKLFRTENQGNITKSTSLDENGNINLNTSYVNDHVYNQLGHLETTTTTFLTGAVENYTYEYW
ncbi:MAG: hypothetical protein AB8G15_09245 [Saprospiraceae bacterium]